MATAMHPCRLEIYLASGEPDLAGQLRLRFRPSNSQLNQIDRACPRDSVQIIPVKMRVDEQL